MALILRSLWNTVVPTLMEYQHRPRRRNGTKNTKSSTMLSPWKYFLSFSSHWILPAPAEKVISTEEPVPAVKRALSTTTSLFQYRCHHLVDPVSREVDGYFLKHWHFENEKARKRFVAAGFSRVTCLYFPLALDDRIHHACQLLTILFLIDGECSMQCFDNEVNQLRYPRTYVF